MTNQPPNIIIYNTAYGKASMALYARDGKIWLNKQQMEDFFATSKSIISIYVAGVERDIKERKET